MRIYPRITLGNFDQKQEKLALWQKLKCWIYHENWNVMGENADILSDILGT